MLKEILVPDIGAYKDVPVIELLVKVGDKVEKDTSLITLETDKATMEVPSPFDGIIKSINVKVGDKISEGSVVLSIETEESEGAKTEGKKEESTEKTSKETSETKSPEVKKEKEIEIEKTKPVEKAAEKPAAKLAASLAEKINESTAFAHASPGVRRFARLFGADITRVVGTGPKDRILREDVQNYIKHEVMRSQSGAVGTGGVGGGSGTGLGVNLPPWPDIDFSKFGEIEKQPLPRIKKLSGAFLHRNWVMVPHITQFDEADITTLEQFRKDQQALAEQDKIKLTLLPFIMKAVATSLHAFPTFNASLDASGSELILKKYCHIGVAVDTPNGLVVPVVRDVDQKGLFQLSKELGEISGKARAGQLTGPDMQGSSFSISSLGGIGGTAFTPIINVPDVAILGVSKAQIKPIFDGNEFKPKLMLPLSLSYDHRVIDGAEAARFITYLVKQLSDIRRLLL